MICSIVLYNHVKIKKIVRAILGESPKDTILNTDTFRLIFVRKTVVFVLRSYGAIPSSKKSRKSLERFLRKNGS